jgi:hypothetical protein
MPDTIKKIKKLRDDVVNHNSEKKLSITIEYGEKNENSAKLSDVLVCKMNNMTL